MRRCRWGKSILELGRRWIDDHRRRGGFDRGFRWRRVSLSMWPVVRRM